MCERIHFLSAFTLLMVEEISLLPIVPGGGNLLFLASPPARRAQGAMILTSNRLLHHVIVVQIEESSNRLRQHAELVPEHVRSKAAIQRPPAPKRCGRDPPAR